MVNFRSISWSTKDGRRLIFEDLSHVLKTRPSVETDKVPHPKPHSTGVIDEFIDRSQSDRGLAKRVIRAFKELQIKDGPPTTSYTELARRAHIFADNVTHFKAQIDQAKLLDNADAVIVFRKQTAPVFGHAVSPARNTPFGQAIQKYTADKNRFAFSLANNVPGDVHKTYGKQMIAILEAIKSDPSLGIKDIVVNLKSPHLPPQLDPVRVREINQHLMSLYRSQHRCEINIRIIS